MPLPVSHSLIGATVVALLHPRTSRKLDWRLMLCGAVLAVSPDLDFFFVFNLHLDDDWHRGFSHSIFFAVVVTCLMLAAAGFSRLKSVLACGAALMSHAVLDFLTTQKSGGVELLFPFSDTRLKLGVFSFSEFGDGFFLPEVVKAGLMELVIFLPIFFAALLIKGYLSPASSIEAAD